MRRNKLLREIRYRRIVKQVLLHSRSRPGRNPEARYVVALEVKLAGRKLIDFYLSKDRGELCN
ncbi:hypothetical protein LCGC14_2276350 [marine sediment metagenome]|uniref:Uncharacterized protein n=1 Tax=marine sediment metagenome TaxID=412755 RepID=A0A0F9FQQ3_9ZZZZ